MVVEEPTLVIKIVSTQIIKAVRLEVHTVVEVEHQAQVDQINQVALALFVLFGLETLDPSHQLA